MSRYYSGRMKLRRSRNGVLFGVCKGIAEWRDLPVNLVRIAFVVLNIVGLLPFWIYLILAVVLPVEVEYEQQGRYRYYEREGGSSRMDGMGGESFDKERDWENRFYNGRKS